MQLQDTLCNFCNPTSLSSLSDKLQCALDACADEVTKKASVAMKQSTLELHMSVVN